MFLLFFLKLNMLPIFFITLGTLSKHDIKIGTKDIVPWDRCPVPLTSGNSNFAYELQLVLAKTPNCNLVLILRHNQHLITN
jgi:hypothetical protein